jgi:exonuclease SbcC
MIERLELRRWRAFDHVAIDLKPGTTFLVAPNGVGKTSLLLGLTWALFGDYSNVDAKACVRIGHDTAEATVTLGLTDGDRLIVHRTITAVGKSSVDYSDGHQSVPAPRASELLVEEFGAPIEIAARLAVIRGSGKDDGELQLREHLYDVFGVSGLRRAAAAASKLHKEAVAARKRLRTASRTQLANRRQLAAEAENLRNELDDLADRRVRLSAAVTEAVRAQNTIGEWEQYDAAISTRVRSVADFLQVATDDGIVATNLDELAEAVGLALTANRASAEEVRSRQDEARAQALASRTALDLLEGHDPFCPTCARPFQGDELRRAVQSQRASLSTAQARIENTAVELAQLADRRRRLEVMDARTAELSRPIPEPDQLRPTSDTEAEVEVPQAALRQHDERAGSVTRELARIVAQLENDEEVQASYAAERIAWRREAVAQASTEALWSTAERLAEEYIEPLSRQVRWRWKALFGEDGLQLRPDGTIVRVVGERQLPWQQLSSGEQIWARLVASVLILRTSTTLPFAWLDEPLEHLDPRARRIVATDLATSTQSGGPAQLIVTTYEHTLARQLAEDLRDTHLRQINRTEMFAIPSRRWEDHPETGGRLKDRVKSTSPDA